jgi:hypothetical protein
VSHSHTLTTTREGSVLLSLETGSLDAEVMVDPSATHAQVVLFLTGPIPEGSEDKFRLNEDGHKVSFKVDPKQHSGGMTTIVSGSGSITQVGGSVIAGDVVIGRRGMSFGNGNVQVNSFGGSSSYTSGDGYSRVEVGDKVIEVINGVTYVNGRNIDEPEDANLTESDRPARPVPMPRIISVRAILPPGSGLNAQTISGDVNARGVRAVGIKTVSGDIDVSGLARDSWVKSVSGDIDVSAADGAQPIVKTETVSGDITIRGAVRAQPRTVSGDIRYR